ncbi:MAG: acyl-CoA dehydrogenase family protein, partial [Bacteroidota bacterium]
MRLTESHSMSGSFSATMGAHMGIGTLPILYFGNPAQKASYLPDLATGRRIAAYCLTEPGSGSDALAAKSQAILSEDGKHYILNGQKMWITNGGIADVFVVFAKIDGEKFTGFIVEADWEGVSRGAEEEKLGLKGSSTRQIFFENVKVPVENVLGEIGKGHQIAFNILNIGRIKLGAAVIGGSKLAAAQTVQYANERKQFGQSIGNFGAIKRKIGEQAIRIFAVESAVYRASSDIQQMEEKLLAEGKSLSEALLGAAEEYAIECAILKFAGSEVLDYVVDEGLQVYGGMGYSEEGPMARAYRDARINRIFEGTNEINRMLSIDMLMKRALRGRIDLFSAATNVQTELMSGEIPNGEQFQGLFVAEKVAVQNLKKATLLVLGATAKELMQQLKDEQEILMDISDMMANAYVAESVLLRVEKLANRLGEEAVKDQIAMMQAYVADAVERVGLHGRDAIRAWAEGDMRKLLLKGLRVYTRFEGVNTKKARRQVADALLAANTYTF